MQNVPELFGSMVFNEAVMRATLSEGDYAALRRTMDLGEPLDGETARAVAAAMKDWAVKKGATHYTHWFQPMTNFTAEKHDSFITPDGDGGVIMEFSGKELIRGEPDASSFPSGGLRATFEARGYTAWDPTSYAFIKDGVLCIPTAFCSYGGEALDKKTPLLRSMESLNVQALRVLRLFGDASRHAYPAVGDEQEYFLIDRELYNRRKDLIYTGRTLLGAKPPKGQELDDYYFGTINLRVAAFMRELNEELWALGILAKTEHNEAAPAQHELAPIFTKCNVAVDHNQITMEIMRKVAEKHGLACLLHEKPFRGVNGSGKHNNWSISTQSGENLFEPGATPEKNARFLTFFCAVIEAVDRYQDLLRIAASTAGNDERLGGNEAPPAIVSIYIGATLERILNAIAEGATPVPTPRESMKIGVDVLPDIPRDTSDRNRTSPIAFTGNKFEFRMLGSSMSAADCNTVLNTAVADVLCSYADELEGAEDFPAALDALLRRTIRAHRRIIYGGNGYDESWYREAERRGLTCFHSAAEALPHLTDEKNVALFERRRVLSRTELRAWRDITLETYCKQVNIEAQVMAEMVRCDVLPAVIGYERELAETVNAKRGAIGERTTTSAEGRLLERVSALCDELYDSCLHLDACRIREDQIPADVADGAAYNRSTVCAAMEAVRAAADSLEGLVSKDFWPYPSYGKLLYSV